MKKLLWINTDAGSRDSGLDEKNDCVVQAVASVACIPYIHAHDRCRLWGREAGEGMLLQDLVYQGGFVTRRNLINANLRETLRVLPPGRFIISVRIRIHYHAFAVLNGVIFDSLPPSPSSRVVDVIELPHNVGL